MSDPTTAGIPGPAGPFREPPLPDEVQANALAESLKDLKRLVLRTRPLSEETSIAVDIRNPPEDTPDAPEERSFTNFMHQIMLRALSAPLRTLSSGDKLAVRARRVYDDWVRYFEQLREAAGPSAETTGWNTVREISLRLARLSDEGSRLADERYRILRNTLRRYLPAAADEIMAIGRDMDRTAGLLKDFFGTTRGLWDLDPADWQAIHWEPFEEAQRTLSEHPELRDLANRIGRSRPSELSDPSPAEKKQDAPAGIPAVMRIESLGRSEITGYTLGSSLDILPATELSWLIDDDADHDFLKRYIEGRLVNVDYLSARMVRLRSEAAEYRHDGTPSAPEKEGPVVLCVDTSGSMTGIPEFVARALVLALARECMLSGRPMYLIAFSTSLEVLDLQDTKSRIYDLGRFLGMSFRGGTDLRPAMNHAMALLRTETWKKADLLIISDFRVPKIMIKRSAGIGRIRKETGARIHALSITPESPTDDMNIFDSKWHFRIDARGGAAGISASQFREMPS